MCYNAKACRNACIDYYSSDDLVEKYTEAFMDEANRGYMNCTIRNPYKIEEIEEIAVELRALGYTLIATGNGIFIDWSGDTDV